jgi:hypothetical protein
MANIDAAHWRSRLGWAASLLWIGILLATLFPFEFHPHNDVTWATDGLQFGRHGIVLSDGPIIHQDLQANTAAQDDSSCTIELLLKPASRGASSTIAAFSRNGSRSPFELRQYRDMLVVLRGRPAQYDPDPDTQRDIVHIFNSAKTILLTLSSGPKGTAVYADGRLVQRLRSYTLSRRALGGVLTLGTDPVHMNPWSGELQGFALYDHEVSTDELTQHCQAWLGRDEAALENLGGQMALFTFHEGQGTRLQNLRPPGANLIIPEFFQLPLKPFLAAPWTEFSPSWEYVNDVLRNILGFLPFGFALSGYLSLGGKVRHAVLITILAGALTSLGIEILQGFIPQRESGVTDIITNTLGTVLGAYLVRWKPIAAFLGLLPGRTSKSA